MNFKKPSRGIRVGVYQPRIVHHCLVQFENLPADRRINITGRFHRLDDCARLADFDLSAAPTVNPPTIATLASCAYLEAGEPIVLVGDSGTGKTHLLIGLGMAACEQGRRVRYATAAQLVNELVEAADERRLSRLVARYGRLDLLCLDLCRAGDYADHRRVDAG